MVMLVTIPAASVMQDADAGCADPSREGSIRPDPSGQAK
jgi:hypothetical protein